MKPITPTKRQKKKRIYWDFPRVFFNYITQPLHGRKHKKRQSVSGKKDVKTTVLTPKTSRKALILYFILLGLLLIGSIFLHFYLIAERLHFNIDEANQLQTIWQMWITHTPVLKGPPASGDTNLYHGAFFYYLYLIPVALSHGNPVGSAVFTAILGVATIWLLATFVREVYGEATAIVASYIYAVSYYVLIYSRWAWNPNVIPFFMVLSLFALTKVSKGKQWYLILFAFAVAAISQLHVGGLIFLPIYLLLLPYLVIRVWKWHIWILSVLAFLLPWIPTLIYEFSHNFELIRALILLLQSPAHISFVDHIVRGYNYLSGVFALIIQVPQYLVVLMLLCSASTFIYALWRPRNVSERVISCYLLLAVAFSFVTYAYYPGLLFVHLGEQLFPLYALMAAFFISPFIRVPQGRLAALAIIILISVNNWGLYQTNIINGFSEYSTFQRICAVIQQHHGQNVVLRVNDMANPVYVGYVCEHQFGIRFGGSTEYDFQTDYNNQFAYTITPLESQSNPIDTGNATVFDSRSPLPLQATDGQLENVLQNIVPIPRR